MVQKGVLIPKGSSSEFDYTNPGFPAYVIKNSRVYTAYEAKNSSLDNKFKIGLLLFDSLSNQIRKGVVLPYYTDVYNKSGNRTPIIVERNGRYYCIFCGYPDNHYVDSLAISKDFINWVEKSIVIPRGGSSDADAWGNISGSIIERNGRYYCYITASGDSNREWFRVLLYITKDFINYTKKGVILTIGSLGELDSGWAAHPGIMYYNSRFYLYYVATEHRVAGRIMCLATSKDGINFTKKGVTDPLGEAGNYDDKIQNFILGYIKNGNMYQFKGAKDNSNAFRVGFRIVDNTMSTHTLRPLEDDNDAVVFWDGKVRGNLKYMENLKHTLGDSQRGLYFNGVNTRVLIGDPTDGSLDFDFRTESMTFMVKLNVRGDNAAVKIQNVLQKKSSGTGVPGYTSWILKNALGGYMRFRLLTANEYVTHGTNTKINGTGWHTVAFVYDASTGNINAYTDGQLDNYQGSPATFNPTATSVNSDNAVIGSNSSEDGGFLYGDIEYIGVFKRALTASEILDYHNGKDLRGDSDLKLYHNYTEPIGAKDLSGQGTKEWTSDPNDGTLKPVSGSVTDETFTSDYDTPVQLDNTNIVSNTEVVTTTDGLTTFTKGTDYTMDYLAGTITVLSSGSMADATDYLIDYEYGGAFPKYIGQPNHGIIAYSSPSWDSDGLTFDRTVPDFAVIPYDSSADPLKGNNPYTFIVGLKLNTLPSSVSDNMVILEQEDGSGIGRIWLMLHTDDIMRTHLRSSPNFFGGSLSTNTWYLFVIRFDGTTIELFQNNVAGDSGTDTPDEGADGDYYIAARPDLTDPAAVTIDYLTWFKRKLTDSELTEIYNWWRSRH